jgi:hypothetical protein
MVIDDILLKREGQGDVAKLAVHNSPFVHPVWLPDPVNILDVEYAIAHQQFDKRPFNSFSFQQGLDRTLLANDYELLKNTIYKFHVERIAYLTMYRASDPIELDLGCDHFTPSMVVREGFHRLGAAIIRKDISIPCVYKQCGNKFIEGYAYLDDKTRLFLNGVL